jgi:hypothetical protein
MIHAKFFVMCHSRESGNPGIKFTVPEIKQEIKMKRNLFLSILIVFFTTSFMSLIGCNNQTPTKEQSSVSENKIKFDYELQEKCGKRSEQWVKKEYDGLGFSYSHKNHHNKKLNKCFVLVSYTDNNVYNEILFDVNENNKLGGFTFYTVGSIMCHMLGKNCNSRGEWDSLVKPYMTE